MKNIDTVSIMGSGAESYGFSLITAHKLISIHSYQIYPCFKLNSDIPRIVSSQLYPIHCCCTIQTIFNQINASTLLCFTGKPLDSCTGSNVDDRNVERKWNHETEIKERCGGVEKMQYVMY